MKNMEESRSRILEINLISVQGLKPPSTNISRFQTYSSSGFTHPRTSGPGSTTSYPKIGLGTTSSSFGSTRISSPPTPLESPSTSSPWGILGIPLLGVSNWFLGTVWGMPSILRLGRGLRLLLRCRFTSEKFEGVLNFATAAYNCDDFKLMSGLKAVCFRDLMGGEKWHRRLSMIGSRRSENSSSKLDVSSLELSDGNGWRSLMGKGMRARVLVLKPHS